MKTHASITQETPLSPADAPFTSPGTESNLDAAFGGESMASRKYLFFADVAKTLGHKDLAKLFRDTSAQETEHAFAHFRLRHPEPAIQDPEPLSEFEKLATWADASN